MSDRAAEAYRDGGRDGGRGTGASLVVRYVCITSWASVLGLVLLATLMVGVVATESLEKALHMAPSALAFLALVSFARFPVVTIRARVEGGHLVVSGRRWPGPETLWSCTLAEAVRFEEQTVASAAPARRAKLAQHRLIALRTSEDQLLGLTHVAYPMVRFRQPQVVARLNGWLAAQMEGGQAS